MFRVMIYAPLNVKQVNTEVYTFVITAQLNVISVQILVTINVLIVHQVLLWIHQIGVLEHVLRVIIWKTAAEFAIINVLLVTQMAV